MTNDQYSILRRLEDKALPVRDAGSLESRLEEEIAKGTVRKVTKRRYLVGPLEERYQLTRSGEEYLAQERRGAYGRTLSSRPSRRSYGSTRSNYCSDDDWTMPSILSDTSYTHHSTHSDTGFLGFGGGDSGGAGASDSWGGGDSGGGDCGGGDCGGGGE